MIRSEVAHQVHQQTRVTPLLEQRGQVRPEVEAEKIIGPVAQKDHATMRRDLVPEIDAETR